MTSRQAIIRWAEGAEDLQGAIALRTVVFCQEQGVPAEEEIDGRDGEAEHLVALDPDTGLVVGTLRLLFDGSTVKVGRVAVALRWRHRGLASEMLAQGLERAGDRGALRARLASQLDVVRLYELHGFEVESEVFHEAGIAHVWMSRALS